MRTAILAMLLAACSSTSADNGAPYSNAKSEMCGPTPSGRWAVKPRARVITEADAARQCQALPVPVWDFAMTEWINVSDMGCHIMSSGYGGYLDVNWSAPSEYMGTIDVTVTVSQGMTCRFTSDVTLTPAQ